MLFHSEQQRKTLGVPSEGFSTVQEPGHLIGIRAPALRHNKSG